MKPIFFVDLGECAPREEVSFLRKVMETLGKDKTAIPAVLVVSYPQTRAYSLGRFQVPSVALRPPEQGRRELRFQRLTGGKAVYHGEGTVVISLVLSSPSAFSDPIPFGKVINRYVRGILRGLNALGFNAMYYGGDFLAVNRKKAGYLTMEMDGDGVVLFQAVLAWDREYPLPEELSNYPPVQTGRHPEPEPTSLSRELKDRITREDLVEAIVNGYQKRFGLRLDREGELVDRWKSGEFEERVDACSPLPFWEDDPKGWRASHLFEYPLGFFQVWVKGLQNQLEQVKLTGDLITGSGGVALLEETLAKTPANWEELGRAVDHFFSDSNHYILGVKDLKIIPEAVLDAVQPGDPGKASS